MRARYSAFALGLARFVMDTTHPEGSSFEADRAQWERSILHFAGSTSFDGLEIVETSGNDREGHVTFKATLRQGEQDASFTERSRFLRESGAWLYHSGDVEASS